MTLHDATRMASRVRHFRLPSCPLCGDMLLAPMLAEHVSERLVHNHWACESCGYTFRKSFEFAPQREPDAIVCNA
jgi:C4-type Zn-finger protein